MNNNVPSNRTATNMLVKDSLSFIIGHNDTIFEVGMWVWCVCVCVVDGMARSPFVVSWCNVNVLFNA